LRHRLDLPHLRGAGQQGSGGATHLDHRTGAVAHPAQL
jgi:hypothetical protein